MIVDTLGLILALIVTPADVTDREAARPLIAQTVAEQQRRTKLWADQNYSGELVAWANGFGVTVVVNREGADQAAINGAVEAIARAVLLAAS